MTDGEAKKGRSDKRVGQLLLEEGLIDEAKLRQALQVQAEQGGKLFEVLIRLEYLDKKDLHAFLSKQSGVPSIDLANYDIPRELITIIPREFAQEHVVLPIDKMGKLLTVGMACPLDTATLSELQEITGLRVKAMLCRFDEIRRTIRRYYPAEKEAELEDKTAPVVGPEVLEKGRAAAPAPRAPRRPALARDAVVAQLEQIELLPAFGGAVEELLEAAGGASASVQNLAGIISTDPALAAAVLRVANAAPYGLPARVTSAGLATALLGVSATGAVAGACAQAHPLAEDLRGAHAALAARSAFCANAAMGLAKTADRGRPADAHTAGLLHDVGRLALMASVPEAYPNSAAGDALEQLLQAELDAFGLAHPEAAHILARKWRLPDPVANAIRFHHHPYDAPADDLIAVVALAALMAETFERGGELSVDHLRQYNEVLAFLDIDPARAMSVYVRTASSFKRQAGGQQ